MQCMHPMTITVDGYITVVPCGRCVGCRIAKSREWAVRILHESQYHENNCFVTLTYDDEHLPAGGVLVKSDLQKWLKRVRRSIEPRKIKYYGCGEYGSQTKRPHYHIILLGIGPHDDVFVPLRSGRNHFASETWILGNIYIGNVTYESARYVCNYMNKDDRRERFPGNVLPFKLMSNGLGQQWIIDNMETVIENGYRITVNGVDVGIPRYYMDYIGMSSEYQQQRSENALQSTYRQLERADYDTKKYFSNAHASNRQRERNENARDNLFRSKL